MQLDTKQKVLVAIYTEYQKDFPNMESITAESLGMDKNVFDFAVVKLSNEGLIKGANIIRVADDEFDILMYNVLMTSYGLNYIETKLQIDTTLSGEEKVKTLIGKATEWGWDQIKDFGAKVLAEMMK